MLGGAQWLEMLVRLAFVQQPQEEWEQMANQLLRRGSGAGAAGVSTPAACRVMQ